MVTRYVPPQTALSYNQRIVIQSSLAPLNYVVLVSKRVKLKPNALAKARILMEKRVHQQESKRQTHLSTREVTALLNLSTHYALRLEDPC